MANRAVVVGSVDEAAIANNAALEAAGLGIEDSPVAYAAAGVDCKVPVGLAQLLRDSSEGTH